MIKYVSNYKLVSLLPTKLKVHDIIVHSPDIFRKAKVQDIRILLALNRLPTKVKAAAQTDVALLT